MIDASRAAGAALAVLDTAPHSAEAALAAASRAGKRGALIHVEPETFKRLKRLGLEQDRTLQALGLEVLDTLLEKYENPQ